MKDMLKGEKGLPGLRDCIVVGLVMALNVVGNVAKEEDSVFPPPGFPPPPLSPSSPPPHLRLLAVQVLDMQPLLLCSPSPARQVNM